jgi:hypothetical protein
MLGHVLGCPAFRLFVAGAGVEGVTEHFGDCHGLTDRMTGVVWFVPKLTW